MLLADIESLLPSWMLAKPRQHFAALMSGFAATLDALTEGVYLARFAGLPGMRDVPGGNGFDDVTALPLTGRDKNIRGGLAEPPWDWAARQRAYLDLWARSATPVMLLDQLAAILSPNPPILRLITSDGTWWTRAPDGRVTQLRQDGAGITYDPSTGALSDATDVPHAWDWDSATVPPTPDQGDVGRFWIVMYAPCNLPYLAADDGTFNDDGLIDDFAATPNISGAGASPDAGTIGTAAPIKHVDLVRHIVYEWRAAGLRCAYLIVTFDPDSFDPLGDSVPTSVTDGRQGWHTYYDVTDNTRYPGRFSGAEYIPANPGGQW